MSFTVALSDTAPAALRPSIEKYYNSSYELTSLLFVANALGYIMAAVFIEDVTSSLGRARTYLLCQLLIAVGQITLACALPLPVFLLAFSPIGFGASFNLALSNVFCGRFGIRALGAMHGAYSLGAVANPILVALTIDDTWSCYYFLTSVLVLVSGLFAAHAFWNYEEEMESVKAGPPDGTGKQEAGPEPARVDLQGMLSAVSTRVVLVGAPFILAFRMTEVSISGWGLSSTSTPTSGFSTCFLFWAGIAASRFLLCSMQRVDEQQVVYGAVVAAATFELLVWLAPGAISNLTSVVALGLLLGPVYPCAAAALISRMSKHERIAGIGVISAFGSAGGAAAPFTTGLMGPSMLHLVAVGLFSVMLSFWGGLPENPKRTE